AKAEALVALGRADRVAIVDTARMAVVAYVPVGRRVWHLALSPDGRRAFTTDGVSDTVSVIDIPERRLVTQIKVGRSPWGVVVAP
ncbi:MAG: hypothetical protein ACK40H_05310, partial [Sphingomonadaceae bacterium]